MLVRLIAALAVILTLSGHALAAEADASVRRFNDQLLAVMKEGQTIGFKGRAERYRVIVGEAYDMAAITKSMLGPAAAGKLGPDEQARLVEAYAGFSAATYAAQFDDWEGERFEVGETRPSVGGAVIVQSWIAPKTAEPTQIDYVLRQDQGGWRIVDVLFDGTVSQVAVRRSEFGSIFRAKGLPGLLEVIDKQTKALEKK